MTSPAQCAPQGIVRYQEYPDMGMAANSKIHDNSPIRSWLERTLLLDFLVLFSSNSCVHNSC